MFKLEKSEVKTTIYFYINIITDYNFLIILFQLLELYKIQKTVLEHVLELKKSILYEILAELSKK